MGPSPTTPEAGSALSGHRGAWKVDGGEGEGPVAAHPTPQPVLYNITVRSITGVQKEVTVH